MIRKMGNDGTVVQVETKAIRAKHREAKKKQIIKSWQLYVFLILPLIYLAVFMYYPMYGLQIAFKKFTIGQGIWGSPWVGLQHFAEFFNSYMFWKLLRNTLIVSLYSLVCSFPIAVILALCLNCVRAEKFKKTVQTVTYIPHFFSLVVVVGMMTQLFNPHFGSFGTIWKAITGTTAPDILGIPQAFFHMYVWSTVWQNMGYNSIIYIAALSSVDTELYESAQIDGASRFKIMTHIDIPSIMPTIVIMLILRCGTILGVGYEKTLLMQNPRNLEYSQVISTYVYELGLNSGTTTSYSYVTAIGMFNSVINFICIWSVNKLAQKVGDDSLW